MASNSNNSKEPLSRIVGHLPFDNSDSSNFSTALTIEKHSDNSLIENILEEYISGNPYQYIGGLDTAHGRRLLLQQINATSVDMEVVRTEVRAFS